MRLTIRLQKLQGEGGGEERMEPHSRVSTGNDKKKVKNNNENKL